MTASIIYKGYGGAGVQKAIDPLDIKEEAILARNVPTFQG